MDLESFDGLPVIRAARLQVEDMQRRAGTGTAQFARHGPRG